GNGPVHGDPGGTGYAVALTGNAARFVQDVLSGTSSEPSASSTSSPPQSGTATRLFVSDLAPTSGEVVTFTAVVSASDGSFPSGSVTFLDSGHVLGQANLDARGRAFFSLSTATLAVGQHSITALYGSGSQLSQSAPRDVTVSQAARSTTTTLTVSASGQRF